jgi:hypothetical protein
MSAIECSANIRGESGHHINPTVCRLAIHLENDQMYGNGILAGRTGKPIGSQGVVMETEIGTTANGAGTGKTHTVRAVAAFLARLEMHCAICYTTGIVAAQYQGRQTVHSAFGFGIDKDQKKDFGPTLEKAQLARGVYIASI